MTARERRYRRRMQQMAQRLRALATERGRLADRLAQKERRLETLSAYASRLAGRVLFSLNKST